MSTGCPGPQPPLHLIIELVRAAQAGDAHGVASGEWNRYLLRDPDGSGRYQDGELLWDESMQADLSACADLASARQAVDRLAAIMREFLATAGWAGVAARIAAARAVGRLVILTVRSAAHELTTLPWELLDVGGTPLCEDAGCVLRYQQPGLAAMTSAPPRDGGRVLMAWSAAGGGVPAAEHIEAIFSAAQAGGVAFDRGRDVVASASVDDLEAALGASDPPVTILHVLCHGQELPDGDAYGLRLDGASGPVTPARIRALLAPHRTTLRMVVLAACMGSHPGAADNALGSVAQAIHQAGVPAVIASRYPLSAAGSVVLAQRLYRRLWVDLWPIERAFVDVRSALGERTRGPDEPRDLDRAAVQLYGRAELGLDFRPWIIRPYRGLEPYGREHRRLFFGRDHERRELRDRVAEILASGGPRLVLVAGASGTGKSSLVVAGLAPDLEDLEAGGTDARRAGQPAWTTVVMRPGEGGVPADILARRVDEHGRVHGQVSGSRASPAHTLLVIDQLEELFTVISDAGQREVFLRALWRLATEPGGQVFVVATMRIEYLGRFGAVRMNDDGVPFDREMLAGGRYYLVRQMGPEQHERVIAGPAEAVGVRLEPGLVGRLLAALRAEPGALPLLSYTLDQLWQRRSVATVDMAWPGAPGERVAVTGWWLTDRAYDELGGIEGALATTADALLARLAPAHQDELCRVLVQLVHGHEDPTLATRRRGWRLAMRPDADRDAEAARIYDEVIDTLVTARLLVQGSSGHGEPWIELAHDSLIRFWPRLGAWYREARAWLAHTDELRDMARAWQPHARGHDTAGARDREEPYLLRGQRLSYQLEMWQRHSRFLGARDRRTVQAFLDACARAEGERKAEILARERAARRRVRAIAASAVVVAVIMSTLGLWARGQQRAAEAQRNAARVERDDKERQRAIAEDRAIAARDASLVAGARELLQRNEPTWAGKLLFEVARPAQARAWMSLVAEALAIPTLSTTLRGHHDRVNMVAFSPDGARVVTASDDGTARVWRADGRAQPVILRGHASAIEVARFSPDGARVVTASHDGTARVWRADGTGQPVVLEGHDSGIRSASFSRDGTRVVTASSGRVRVWRSDGTGQAVVLEASLLLPVILASFTPDGEFVVTADTHAVRRWRADGDGQALVIHDSDDIISAAALSPDGTMVITGTNGASAEVWRTDGSGQGAVLQGHQGRINAVAFSPDNQLVVTASSDDSARVWRADGTGEPAVLNGHEDSIVFAEFSPDSQLVVTASLDGTARVWRADGKGRPLILSRPDSRATELFPGSGLLGCTYASFSPDGARVVTASAQGLARVWRIAGTGQPLVLRPRTHQGFITSAALSPDGTRVLTAVDDGVTRIWRADGTGRPVDIKGSVAAFSPDGQRVVTAHEYTVMLWRGDGTGEPVILGKHLGPVRSAAFRPDGRFVVTTAYQDASARVWPVDDDHEPMFLQASNHWIYAAMFSRDSERILTTAADGTARLWRVDGKGVAVVIEESKIRTAAMSPDRRFVVTTAHDSQDARVWRADGTGQPSVLSGHDDQVLSAVFDSNGARVLTTSADGTARLWRADGAGRPVVFRGHEQPVVSAAFSRDEALVVTASVDGTARLWRVDGTGEPVIFRHQDEVLVAAFSSDGRHILTASLDGTARLWSIDIADVQPRLGLANTDCLPPLLRRDHLGESEAEARTHYQACERDHGRSPAVASESE